MAFRAALICFSLFINYSILFSQNGNYKLYFIITKEGAEHIGELESETDLDVSLRLRSKELLVIPRTNIQLFEPVTEDNFLRGKYAAPNRFANRYIIGSSAISPGKNQVYFNSVYGLTWTIDYGINERYSAGLSSTILGIPLLLNGQANYKIGNQLYFGATATAGWLSWAADSIFFGYGGVRITKGSKSNNYTFGGGYFSLGSSLPAPTPSNVSLDDFAYLNFSGAKRYTRSIYGIAEVWVMKNLYLDWTIYMINPGFRITRKDRAAWTFYLTTIAFHEFRRRELHMVPIPTISWSRKFGIKAG